MSIKKSNLNDEAYTIIKNKIQLREIKPGDHIFLRDLAKEFDVSLTPIQYALGQLEIEGLVKRVPNKGAMVVGLSKKCISELMDVRLLIEEYACKTAIKSNYLEKWVINSSQIINKMREYTDDNVNDSLNFKKYIYLDESFHQSILKLSGNEKLLELYNYIESQMRIIRIFYSKSKSAARSQEIMREHNDILIAFKEKNYQKAKNAIKKHILNTKKIVLKREDLLDFL